MAQTGKIKNKKHRSNISWHCPLKAEPAFCRRFEGVAKLQLTFIGWSRGA